MRIVWEQEESGATRLTAEPEEYDAFPPMGSVLLDAPPARRDADREALAAYLLFGRWMSGEASLPGGPSPHLAEAIERDASPVRLRVRNVESAPRALPRGERAVQVVFGLPDRAPRMPTLAVVPSTVAGGLFRTADLMVIPSNAVLLDWVDSGSLRARLGVAVLFAADAGAEVLRLAPGELGTDEQARLTTLLLSVNLELSVDSSRGPS